MPTSEGTADRARALGIPLATLADHARLDLVVDGADEVDNDLNLIKGLGRALLREKIVEIHADRFVVVVDESKMVQRLGRGPFPVDVVPFGLEAQLRWLNTLGCRAELRLEKMARRSSPTTGTIWPCAGSRMVSLTPMPWRAAGRPPWHCRTWLVPGHGYRRDHSRDRGNPRAQSRGMMPMQYEFPSFQPPSPDPDFPMPGTASGP